MKKLCAYALSALLAPLAAAQTTTPLPAPLQLMELGAEPACAQSDFFGKYFEKDENGTAASGLTPATLNILHRHYHPMEFEFINGVGTQLLDPVLASDMDKPRAGIGKLWAAAITERKAKVRGAPKTAATEAFMKAYRARMRAAIEKQLTTAAVIEKPIRLTKIDARLTACRMSHIGKRDDFKASLQEAQRKTPETNATSVYYWAGFARSEMKQYLADTATLADGKAVTNYKDLWSGMSSRAAAALAGAADAAKQQAMVTAGGLTYTVPVPAQPAVPGTTSGANTEPKIALTAEELRLLPKKLVADYLKDKKQIEEANKGKSKAELAKALEPVIAKYSEIAATVKGMTDAAERKKFEDAVEATKPDDRQGRDALAQAFVKKFKKTAQQDLQAVREDGGNFDGNTRKGDATGVVVPNSDTSKVSAAEEAARLERERRESEKGLKTPTLIASGITEDKDSSSGEKKEENPRDLINGAKLGLWGALVGFFLMGPVGALLFGALCVGLGTVMSKEMNK